MKTAIEEAILWVGGSLALSTLAKATLAMILGLSAAALAGRKHAAFRHALLAGMFGVLLALPLVSAVSPPVRIAVRLAQARNLPALRAMPGGAAPPGFITRSSIPARSQAPGWQVPDLLMACWIAGTALFLLPVGVGLRQVRRLRKSGLPWQHGQPVADGLAMDAGIRRHVDVLLHEELAGPMTCGAARPAILLPLDAPNWDSEDLNRAMVHEMEHVIRRDWAMHCVARAVCGLYWFHPLVWMAWRRLELEAERSCDDAVLARSEATAYANQLVALARRLSAAARSPLPAMASRADLASRVSAVLDGGQRRGRAGALCITAASVVAAALVVTVSPLRVVAAPQSAGTGARARMRTDTMLVVTPVKVSYPNGNTVEGLAAGDFTVTEDGVQQTISLFEFQKVDGAEPPSSYYLLGYYPRNGRADGAFRKIGITVKSPTTAQLDYRPGYYVLNRSESAPSGAGASPAAGTTPPPLPYTRAPILLFKKEAEYSEEARKAKYQGMVLLDVEVDTSGKATNIRVARSLGLGLDEKAIEAVRQWRFKPAEKDGTPVSAQVELEVSFRLL